MGKSPCLACWISVHIYQMLSVVTTKLLSLLVGTIRPCVVCNPLGHNAESFALRSSCTGNSSGLGMPNRRDDCYCQPVEVLKVHIAKSFSSIYRAAKTQVRLLELSMIALSSWIRKKIKKLSIIPYYTEQGRPLEMTRLTVQDSTKTNNKLMRGQDNLNARTRQP